MLSKMYKLRTSNFPCRSPKIYLPRFVEKESNKSYSASKTFNFVWPYVYPNEKSIRKTTRATVALLFSAKVLNAYVPFILKEAVDSLTISNPVFLYTGSLFFGYAISRALVIGLQELRVSIFAKVITNAMKDVSSKVFSHLHLLDYNFHQQSTRITLFSVGRSIKGIETYLRFTSLYIIPTVLEFGLASGVLLYYCGLPYLLSLGATVSIYYKFTTKYSDIRQKYNSEQKMKSKALDFVINESMLHFETVKYFNNEALEKSRYNHFLEQKLNNSKLITTSLSKLNFGQNLIFNLGLGVNLLLAINQIKQGTMTIGDIFVIQTLFMSLQSPLNFLGSIYRELNEAQVEINELFEILELKSKIQEKPDAKPYEFKGGKIEIQQVELSAGKKIFNGIDMTIEPGTTNAIVGESGSGKSTIFRMIYRLYDPDQGRILIDGQDLRDLTIDSIRKNIAIVPQNPQLFNDTIYYNISYGNPQATKEKIIEACKVANIHNRIMEFPDNYESLVGELGNKLSGGEKQRLALARCLIKDAKFYFFDEFTSAMDSHNEQEILNSIKTILKGKTIIYNSHRLSSITSVNKIFVLSEGKISESGTHNELVSNKESKYFKAWEKFISTKG